MANGVLTDDCDRVLGPDRSRLYKESVAHILLNLLDFFDGSILSQVVQEEIHVRSWCDNLVVVTAKTPLGVRVLLGHGEKRSDNSGASDYDIVPVQISKRRLGEQVEVRLEMLHRVCDCQRAVGLPFGGFEWHDVFLLEAVGLSSEISGTNLHILLVTLEDRNEVELFGDGMVRVLGEDLA